MITPTSRLTTPADIMELGTILTVWAHPDDESYLAGGLLATATQQGQSVICVTATKGEGGMQYSPNCSPKDLGKIRIRELTEALRILGIKQHYLLNYQDGGCADVPSNDAVHKLAAIIDKEKPDTIITFGPEGWTGHPDHCSVSHWTSLAVRQLQTDTAIYHAVITPEHYDQYLKKIDEKLDVFFNIDTLPFVEPEACDIYYVIPYSICTIKQQAIRAMPSQTEGLFSLFDKKYLEKAWSIEAYIRAN